MPITKEQALDNLLKQVEDLVQGPYLRVNSIQAAINIQRQNIQQLLTAGQVLPSAQQMAKNLAQSLARYGVPSTITSPLANWEEPFASKPVPVPPAYREKTYSDWARGKRSTLMGSIAWRLLGDRKSGQRKLAAGFRNLTIGRFRRGRAKLRTGGMQLAKGAGLNRADQWAVGRAAVTAGWVGAFGVLTAALAKGADALRSWTKNINDDNLKFSSASPSMSIIEMQKELREFFRNRRKGEALAESAAKTMKSQQDLEDQAEDFDVWWQGAKNWTARNILNPAASVLYSGFNTINDNKVGTGIGLYVGGVPGAVAGSLIEEGGRQSTDWLGKHMGFLDHLHPFENQWGYDSDYYKRKENRKYIEEELADAVRDGDQETQKILRDILDKLPSSGYDLSGWMEESREIADKLANDGDGRIRHMRGGGPGKRPNLNRPGQGPYSRAGGAH